MSEQKHMPNRFVGPTTPNDNGGLVLYCDYLFVQQQRDFFKQQRDQILAALKLSQKIWLHAGGLVGAIGKPCECVQCEFVRARDAVIASVDVA